MVVSGLVVTGLVVTVTGMIVTGLVVTVTGMIVTGLAVTDMVVSIIIVTRNSETTLYSGSSRK
jgi:hypothetical protein